MTAVNQWWRNPKSQNSEAIEAIRVPHFAYSLYKKPEHELSATKNSSHHQTNHDKTILFPLNKSCPQSTPALPGNPSSTKGFCQLHHWLFPQGLWQPGITNTTTGGCAFVRQKNISWCLAAGKDNASNTGIFKLKSLHFQKCLYSHYKKGDFDFFDNM